MGLHTKTGATRVQVDNEYETRLYYASNNTEVINVSVFTRQSFPRAYAKFQQIDFVNHLYKRFENSEWQLAYVVALHCTAYLLSNKRI